MDDKRCTRCGVVKSRSHFYVNRGWTDGLHPYCKPCLLAYQRDARLAKLDAADPDRRRWTKWTLQHEFFRSIDQPIKAYLLGLLAADGNVLASTPRVTLELQESDIELVELLRDLVAPGARIGRRRRTATIAFTSETLVADLAQWGIAPRKTYDLEWPTNLPRDMWRPFLLGYFDGDGFTTTSRSWGTYAYWRWGLVGLPAFVAAARDFIESELGLRRRALQEKGMIVSYHVTGRDAVLVDEWLHAGFDLGLERKRFKSRRDAA